MSDTNVRLERLTRMEFREAREAGHFKAAIIATGSIEQHLEHLAMSQDIACSTYVAEQVAKNLYPNVVVAVPMSIGISEHHMGYAGTLTAKTGSWLAVLFDAVESLVRHDVKSVLVLNGHGGNVSPLNSAIHQWRMYFLSTQGAMPSTVDKISTTIGMGYRARQLEDDQSEVDLRVYSYWDVIPKEYGREVLETPHFPGHATEFETAVAMYAIPESVRPEAIPLNEDPGPALATAEKGRLLMEKAVEGVTAVVEEMLAA